MLQLAKLAGACLETHSGISLTDLKLFSLADFILVGFLKLRLGLLMPAILLLVVANLIVQLLQIVLQGSDLVLGSTDRVFKAEDVFISLILNITLVSDSAFCRLNFILQALDGVSRRFIGVVFSLAALSQLRDFVSVSQV